MKTLTIARLADEARVNVETIRFYQRKGLLAMPERPPRGIRYYGVDDVERVQQIKAAQQFGFTLAEIKQLVTPGDGMDCADVAKLAREKLAEVRQRIADLQRVESSLHRLVHRCAANEHETDCPLIEQLKRI